MCNSGYFGESEEGNGNGEQEDDIIKRSECVGW